MADRKQEILEEIRNLARASEGKLRAAQWRLLVTIRTSGEAPRASDGALVVAGASLALLVPNLRDLLDIFELADLKVAIGLILLSAIFGVAAKLIHEETMREVREESAYGAELTTVLHEHTERFKELSKEATALGIEVKDPLDLAEMFRPVDEIYPGMVRRVGRELFARESDPDRKWRLAHKSATRYGIAVVFQITLLSAGMGMMLVCLKAPSQPQKPVPLSVGLQTPGTDSGSSIETSLAP
jgi:hypothetical protein